MTSHAGTYTCAVTAGGVSQTESSDVMIQCKYVYQGGNFHLKVGGAKSSGNAGDPMLGVAVIP